MSHTSPYVRFALTAVATLALPTAALAQDADGFAQFTALECSSCHGAQGQGGMGPALASTRLSKDAVRQQVRSPRSRRMPAFDETELSDDGLDAIYSYIRGLAPPSLAAKDTWWNIELLNLPTPALPERGDLELHFTHRFSESITDAGLEGFYGLDSFATPGFWLSYGLTDRIAPYAGRTANLATWEIGVKLALLREGDLDVPLSAAANIGLSLLDADGLPNNSRFTVELPIGLRVGDRVALEAIPMYTSDPDEFGFFEGADAHAIALGFAGSLRLSTKYSLDGEYITNVGGFVRPDSVDQWQAGATAHVNRHLFTLMLTNSTFTTPDFMAAGAFRTGIKSNIRLGFNIVRIF